MTSSSIRISDEDCVQDVDVLHVDDTSGKDHPVQKYHVRAEHSTPLLRSMLSITRNNCVFSGPTEEQLKYAKLASCVIGVEGNICAGKSTLLRNTAKYLRDIAVECAIEYEQPDRELLKMFYDDPKKYAYLFQSMMLRDRQTIHQRCMYLAGKVGYSGNGGVTYDLCKPGSRIVFSDRTLWGDVVFACLAHASGNMAQHEFSAYTERIRSYGPYHYDYILVLDVRADASHDINRAMRMNPEESAIPVEYLQALRRAYYMMLRAMACAGNSRVVLLRNDCKSWVTPRYALDCILSAPKMDQVREIWSSGDAIDDVSSADEVDAAYDKIHEKYAAYR